MKMHRLCGAKYIINSHVDGLNKNKKIELCLFYLKTNF